MSARRILALCSCLVLAACDSPSMRFADGARTVVDVQGSRFAVYRQGDRFEVYRLSREWRPSRRDVLLRAGAAIESLSACRIAPGSMSGDRSIVRARVDCRGDAPPVGLSAEVWGIGPVCVVTRPEPLARDWLPAAELDCVLAGY